MIIRLGCTAWVKIQVTQSFAIKFSHEKECHGDQCLLLYIIKFPLDYGSLEIGSINQRAQEGKEWWSAAFLSQEIP